MILPIIRKIFDRYIKRNNGKRTIIVAKNKEHLKSLIKKEIRWYGKNCDLNHIDVSTISDMSFLFKESKFNGNISNWDVSNVTDMSNLFLESKFNGDISNWDVSNVTNMMGIFYKSSFNRDISIWNMSNVIDMSYMFYCSEFNGDVSKWDVSNVETLFCAFYQCEFIGNLAEWKPYKLNIKYEQCLFDAEFIFPYWVEYTDVEARRKAIDAYHLEKELEQNLIINVKSEKRIKL
jgi:surface protein